MVTSTPHAPPSLLSRAASAARRAARAATASVLATGPLPRHVAFIMDGNRRFAEGGGLDAVKGHEAGYLKLLDALEWCLDLGVATVSVFAFSVDNFRRPRSEVSALMDLAASRLTSLVTEDADALTRHRVRVRVVGDKDLLPPRVARAAAAAEAATATADGPTLNVCLAYASRHELAAAVTRLGQDRAAAGAAAAAAARASPPRAVTPPPVDAAATVAAVDAALYTAGCPPVDLLLRTSGEARLSDFMMWQARGAALAFVPRLWPALSFADLARAVLAYQRAAPALAALREAGEADCGAARAEAAAARSGGASPPQPAAAPPSSSQPPPAPPAAPRRVRGARPGGGGGSVPAWAGRAEPPRRADDEDDEDEDAGRHKFDPQCPCCLGNRRGGADEGGAMPAGVVDVMQAKKAREAAVRAALAAARAAKEAKAAADSDAAPR